MIPISVRRNAPWPIWAGALVVAACLMPLGAQGQDPDSLRADTTGVDSVLVAEALSAQEADTVTDSLAVDNLPQFLASPARSWSNGVWEWDRESLLRAPGLSLAELLYEVPGITPLRGGDFGAPSTVSFFGAAAGRIRVLIDGFELTGLMGGVPDLSTIGIGGLERVRVRRALGGLLIELQTYQYPDSRPFSQIEAGTGDLDTNAFRGTFALPGALGGNLLVTLDRLDTRGRENEDEGTIAGGALRFSLLRGERTGVEGFFSRRGAQRSFYEPDDLTRTDWVVRGRHRFGESLVVGAYFGSSSITAEDPAVADGSLTGPKVRQWGARVGFDRSFFWGSGALRGFSEDGYPSRSVDLDMGVLHPRVGGVGLEWQRQAWDARSTSRLGFRAWTRPLWGFSLFGELDRGDVGIVQPSGFRAPASPPDSVDDSAMDSVTVEPVAPERFDDRKALRYGARFSAWGLDLSAVRVRVEADSLFPTGLPPDRTPLPVPGGTREGYEVGAVVPLLLLDGLTARGTLQLWDSVDVEWPYLPRLQYDARIRYHNTFLETGNLEVLVEFGAREREPMTVFEPDSLDVLLPDPDTPIDPDDPPRPVTATVPFLQNWYARLQIRIVTVLLYVEWENVTLRLENQDFPGRRLPRTRAQYGVRWRLWN